MSGRSRTASRVLVPVVGAMVGAVLLSGSGSQPVTANGYPHWQRLAAPPLSPRTDALGVRIGHRVLVLGGVGSGWVALRDGVSYDLRTGAWHRFRTPVPITARDRVVSAAGVAVLRHRRDRRPACWWTYDPRRDTWQRMRAVPRHLTAPAAFGSEVYAVAGRRVVVYSVQLGRWTALPADPLRPALTRRQVSASLEGTVVTGRVAGRRHLVADRWNGLSWRREPVSSRLPGRPRALPARARLPGATSVRIGSRVLVVDGAEAWIHTP